MSSAPASTDRRSWWIGAAFVVLALLLIGVLTIVRIPEPDSAVDHPATAKSRQRSFPAHDNPMAASLPNADSPHLESKEANAPTEEELVPVEWEGPLFDVLLDQSEGMEHRNAGLIELATVTAQNAPAVQRECLRHLVFGLSDEDGALFLNLSTNVVIPVSLRVDFLKEALAIRPPQLGSWLSSQLVNHHEPQISRLARTYLLNVSTPQSPALPAPEQP